MKSRVPVFGFVVVILFYWISLPVIALTFFAPGNVTALQDLFFSKVLIDVGLTILLMTSLTFSRFFFIGSDLENLLITGVSKWRLSLGIFIFIVLMVSPLLILFSRALMILPLSFSVPWFLFNSASFVLVFLFIITAMLSLVVGLGRSFFAVGLISALNFSNLLGNPFSMGNIDGPQYLWGWAAFLAITLLMAGLLILSISRESYAPYRIVRKRKNELVKDPIEFSGKHGEEAFFHMGFSLSFLTTVNNTSTRGPRYSRLSTGRGMMFTFMCNLVISAFLVYIYNFTSFSSNGYWGDFIIIFASSYGAMIIWSFLSFSLSQERLWLLGSTIGREKFLRTHVIAKSSLYSLLVLPFLMPLLAMALMGQPLFLRAGLFIDGTLVLLSFPASAIGLYISSFLIPEQYVRTEMPASGALSHFVISIPQFFTFIAGVISYFYIWFLPASVVAMYALAFLLIVSPRFHERAFYSMVARRFL